MSHHGVRAENATAPFVRVKSSNVLSDVGVVLEVVRRRDGEDDVTGIGGQDGVASVPYDGVWILRRLVPHISIVPRHDHEDGGQGRDLFGRDLYRIVVVFVTRKLPPNFLKRPVKGPIKVRVCRTGVDDDIPIIQLVLAQWDPVKPVCVGLRCLGGPPPPGAQEHRLEVNGIESGSLGVLRENHGRLVEAGIYPPEGHCPRTCPLPVGVVAPAEA